MTRSDGVTLENKITIDQKQANDAIKQLVSSVNSLAKAFKDATGDSEKLSDSAKKNSQKNSISSLISDISGMVIISRAAVRALSGIKNAVVDMTKEAVEFTETQNLFEVSMGKNIEGLNQYYEKAVQFQDKLTEKLSANMEESMRYQALFNAMSKSMGVASDKAYILSENLVKMGYDLSSLYNIDPKAAMTKLRAGLTGQTKPLREIGIDITQTTLQSVADSLDLGVEVANLSQAEKVLLRYLAVLKQSSVAHGDFARTLSSPANQIRIFNAQITILKRNVGSLGSAILYNIMPYVNAVIMVINKLVQALARLFGVDITSFTSGFGSVSDSVDDIEAGVGGISSGMGGAAKKAKEFVRQLMGFDEINNITLPDTSSSGGGGAGGGGGGGLGTGINQKLLDAIGEYDNLMDKVRSKANDIRDRMLEWLGISEDLRGNLHWSWDDMSSGAKKLAVGLGSIVGLKLATKIIKLVGSLSNLKGVLMGTVTATTPFQKGLVAIKNVAVAVKTKIAALGASGFGVLALRIAGVVGGTISFIAGMKNINNVTNQLTDSTKSLYDKQGDLLQGLLRTTAGGAALGATLGSVVPVIGTGIGGAVGAAVGALSGFVAELIGLNKETKELAESQVFGTLTISTEEWTDALRNSGTSLNGYQADMESFVKSIINMSDGYNEASKSMDTYLTKFSIGVIKMTSEDMTKIQDSVQAIGTNAIGIIQTDTDRSLQLMTEFYRQNDGIIDENEQSILAKMQQNGVNQVEAVRTSQNNITAIWQNALNTRGYLTEEERQQIEAAIAQIEEMAKTHLSKANTDLDYYANEAKVTIDSSTNEIKGLTEEAYKNFSKAAEDYKKEQLDITSTMYNEKKNIIEESYRNGLIDETQYNKDLNTLAEQRKNNELQIETTIEEARDRIFEDLYIKYGEVEGKTDKTSKKMKELLEKTFEDAHIDLTHVRNYLDRDTAAAGDSAKKQLETHSATDLSKVIEINQGRMNALGAAAGNNFSRGIPSIDVSSKITYNSNSLMQKGKNILANLFGGRSASLTVDTTTNQIKFGGFRASGGMVSHGEFFIAREAGPEMVGSINGHTAVANNDQIVQGIKQGVYEAVMSAMSQNRNSTTIKLDLDRAILFKDMQTQANDYYRQSGESPFPA